MNFFLFFFWFLSTLCVCRLSIRFDLLPPPSIESRCIFERKKKWINGQLRSVCHFSQAFIGECDGDSDVLFFCWFFFFFLHAARLRTRRVQPTLFFNLVTPILVISFFLFLHFHISWFFSLSAGAKSFGWINSEHKWQQVQKKKKKQFLRS